MKNKFAQYFAIVDRIKKQGFEAERSELISDFTEGRKNGLSQLSDWEYKELLAFLNRTFPASMDPYEVSKNNMRRKIIAILRKCGYSTGNSADMNKIHGWVEKYGYLKKPMNDYSKDELPKLVTQAENYYKSTLAA